MNETLEALLDELADECRAYQVALAKLKAAKTADEYDAAETELIHSMTHLEGHAHIMLEESLEAYSEFEKVA